MPGDSIRRYRPPAAATFLLLAGLAGCSGFFPSLNSTGGAGGNGSGSGSGYTGDAIYVGNSGNGYIAGFGLASNGSLSVLNNSPYNNGVVATALTVTPGNAYLYVGTLNGIYVYAINSDGSISVLNGGSPAAVDVIPTTMQVDSTGNYLLAAGISAASESQAIGIYQITPSTGLLTALNGSPLGLYSGVSGNPTLIAPTAMLITPNNSLVYVSMGTLGVQVLTLAPGGGLSTGAGPTILPPSGNSVSPSDQGLASDPNTRFLFVAEVNTGLRVLNIGTNGALSEITGSPYPVGTGPTGVIMDPTGSYVYTANKGSGTISGFTFNATSGQLTAIAGSPFNSGGQLPIEMVTDSSKKFLAVINSGTNGSGGNNDLQLFSFDATTPGKLDIGSAASTGTDPTDPSSLAATN